MDKFWDILWTPDKVVYIMDNLSYLTSQSTQNISVLNIDYFLDKKLKSDLESLRNIDYISNTDKKNVDKLQCIFNNFLLISSVENNGVLKFESNINNLNKWMYIGDRMGGGQYGDINESYIYYGKYRSPFFVMKSEPVELSRHGSVQTVNKLFEEYLNYATLTLIHDKAPNFITTYGMVDTKAGKFFSVPGKKERGILINKYEDMPDDLSGCIGNGPNDYGDNPNCFPRKYMFLEKFYGDRIGDVIKLDEKDPKNIMIKRHIFNVLLQLSLALFYAYNNLDFIHRDLHLENIAVNFYKTPVAIYYPDRNLIVNTFTYVQIYDFGISLFGKKLQTLPDTPGSYKEHRHLNEIKDIHNSRISLRENIWSDCHDIIADYINDVTFGTYTFDNNVLLKRLYKIVNVDTTAIADILTHYLLLSTNDYTDYHLSKINFGFMDMVDINDAMKEYIKIEVCFGKGFMSKFYSEYKADIPEYFKFITEYNITDFQSYKYDLYRAFTWFSDPSSTSHEYDDINILTDGKLFNLDFDCDKIIKYLMDRDVYTHNDYNDFNTKITSYLSSYDFLNTNVNFPYDDETRVKLGNRYLQLDDVSGRSYKATMQTDIIHYVRNLPSELYFDINTFINTFKCQGDLKNLYGKISEHNCVLYSGEDGDVFNATLVFGNPDNTHKFKLAYDQIFFTNIMPSQLPGPLYRMGRTSYTYAFVSNKYTKKISVKYGKIINLTEIASKHSIISEDNDILVSGELLIHKIDEKKTYFINTNSSRMNINNNNFASQLDIDLDTYGETLYYVIIIILALRLFRQIDPSLTIGENLRIQPGLNITLDSVEKKTIYANAENLFDYYNSGSCPSQEFLEEYNKFGKDNKIKNACIGFKHDDGIIKDYNGIVTINNKKFGLNPDDNIYKCAWDDDGKQKYTDETVKYNMYKNKIKKYLKKQSLLY